MVFASDILSGRTTGSATLTGLVAHIKAALANRRAYRATVAELTRLDAATLADLGLHRATIDAAARKAVYGI